MPKQKRQRTTVACFSCGRTQTLRPSRRQPCDLYHCGPVGCAKTGATPDHSEAIAKRVDRAAGSFTGVRYDFDKLPPRRNPTPMLVDLKRLQRKRQQFKASVLSREVSAFVDATAVWQGPEPDAVQTLVRTTLQVADQKAAEGCWRDASRLIQALQQCRADLHLQFIARNPLMTFQRDNWQQLSAFWQHLKFGQRWSPDSATLPDLKAGYRKKPVLLVIRERNGPPENGRQSCRSVSAVWLYSDRIEPLSLDDLLKACQSDRVSRYEVPFNNGTAFLTLPEQTKRLGVVLDERATSTPAFVSWHDADRLITALSRIENKGLHVALLREPGATAPMASFQPASRHQLRAFWQDAKYRAGSINDSPGMVLMLRWAPFGASGPRFVSAAILRMGKVEALPLEQTRTIDHADEQTAQRLPLQPEPQYTPLGPLLSRLGIRPD